MHFSRLAGGGGRAPSADLPPFPDRDGEALVFPRKETVEATEDILTDNGVRAQGSPDMMKVWEGK